MIIDIYLITVLFTGLIIGALFGWRMAGKRAGALLNKEKNHHSGEMLALETSFAKERELTAKEMSNARKTLEFYHNELDILKELMQQDQQMIIRMNEQMAKISADYDAVRLNLISKNNELLRTREELKSLLKEREPRGVAR